MKAIWIKQIEDIISACEAVLADKIRVCNYKLFAIHPEGYVAQ